MFACVGQDLSEVINPWQKHAFQLHLTGIKVFLHEKFPSSSDTNSL